MKLIIAGGRDFKDLDLMKREINRLLRDVTKSSVTVISGMADGADIMAYKLAKRNKVKTIPMKADWQDMSEPCIKRYNSRGEYNALAGIKRNHAMGDIATDLIAFWDRKSTGTKDMIDYMKKLGKPVTVIYYKPKSKKTGKTKILSFITRTGNPIKK